ncbi:glycosyltransferase [Profundibacterium mesophilum]|uniref:Glycoprotein 3-alpha-L-fucosyltransferase n=1 Tax=Profundibacterium mesophilum KAUST100406-0324 TaxID=1037889 RepID=A0A921NWB3_9RHOB|nr:glycosyltransferase [Profundibacterium mesophilum]KAF0676526.1 glycoprotein 3-alpha-L-fucosyltransferase [Profundibacterium mesophilum KAUST100406-0324]
MNVLFLHQNFPGQFAHLAPAMAARGDRVHALTSRVRAPTRWQGVEVLPYAHPDPGPQSLHPWMQTLNAAVHRGTSVLRAAEALKARGMMPDLIVAHPGWGEALFLRDLWPRARIALFCEFHYRAEGADVGFDPEFSGRREFGAAHRMTFKNMAMNMQLEQADGGISPTHWQAGTFPPELQRKIEVIHDGIDTGALRPDPAARLQIEGLGSWSRDDELITFVNRNLEPYRGFHVFMRALPELLRRRPGAQVLIVGEDGVSYGRAPEGGGTWRAALTAQIADRMRPEDWGRVHFAGRLSRADFTSMLQVSRVHVYLTYPFVLSWSLLEAMSVGCAVVASGTPPVAEAIEEGRTGRLFDFFDGARMTELICELGEDAAQRARLGAAARADTIARYDLEAICLPAQLSYLDGLMTPRG